MSSAREKLLHLVASEIETLLDSSIVRVGIDGVDGAGKTWFANEPAERSGANVICNPRGHQREVGIATHHRITYFRF